MTHQKQQPDSPQHPDMGIDDDAMADRVDRALELFWSGSGDALEEMVGLGEASKDSFDLMGGVREVSRLAADYSVPASIEGFESFREIGRGGMGLVYRARQVNPSRDVAIKVIRRSRASEADLRRFRYEADSLASLNHAGIASIYQSGVFDEDGESVPFLVMEYIEGEPLDGYLDRSNPSRDERIRLIASICDAIHHAHQRGIIHRDIKPDNILVDASGQPRVVDFGVARPLEILQDRITLDRDGHSLVGTLRYMSPEQINPKMGALDIRSDVYALGVILYESLTGELPYGLETGVPTELLRAIERGVDLRPSGLNDALDQDLVAIVRTACALDPSDRYPSAEAMAADLRRHLQKLPVLARHRGGAYVAIRFAQRHTTMVGAAALSIVVLIGFAVTLSVLYAQSVEARASEAAQRAVAEDELAQRTQVLAFVQNMLEGIDPAVARTMDRELLEMILSQAAARVDEELRDQPRAAATLHATIGRSYFTIGRLREAQRHMQTAMDMHRAHFDEDEPRTADVTGVLGIIHKELAEYERAEELLLLAIEESARLRGREHRSTLYAMESYSHLLFMTGRLEDSEARTRELLALRERIQGENSPEAIESVVNLSGILMSQAKYDEAEPYYLRALESYRGLYGEDHPDTINAIGNLGGFYRVTGRLDDAEPLYRAALESNLRVLGERHPATLRSRHNMAFLLWQLERPAESLPHQIAALEGRVGVLGERHPETANAAFNLVTFHRAAGEPWGFLDRLDTVGAVGRVMPASRADDLALRLAQAAEHFLETGRIRHDDAWPVFDLAMELVRDIAGVEHANFAEVHQLAAAAAAASGDAERSRSILEDARGMIAEAFGAESESVLMLDAAIDGLR